MIGDVFRGFAEEVLDLGMTKSAAASVSKDEAKYTNTSTQEKKCSGCSHFVGGGMCDVVKGKISPDGWCRYWAAGRGSKKEPSGDKSTAYDRRSAAANFDSHGGNS